MRRVIIYILVSIICGACSQTAEEIDTAAQKIVFGVEVSAPETRTALVNENGKYKAIWKAGDTFSVVQIADSDSALYSGTVTEDAASIVVHAEFEQSAATKFTYIFASPAATVSADCSYLEMSLPEEQSPAAMNTFDSTSDLILSNAVERESQPNGENVPFIAERISAVGKMTVKNLPLAEGEQVTSVTFTTTQPLAGSISNIKVSDIVAGNDALLNATYLNPKGTITINLPEPQSGEFALYFSCLPATLPAGSEYSVTVTSTNSTYTKQAQIPSNLSFTAGRMTSFAVNMTDNSQEIASNNKILYTSTDGNIVTPYATDVFGATIVSNTYNNGQGVITFDSDVVSVGEYAFFNCGTLDSITLPEGLCEIKQFAFGSCSALKSINIPENVIIIEGGAFLNNSIEQFSGKFASEDGLTLVMEKTLVAYALGNTAEHYTIPQSIAVIGRSAFNGSLYLTGVTIPNGVVTLEDYAFCNCFKLAQIALPDSVTAIGEDAFFGCDKLVNISLGNGLTTIGYQAFVDCHSLRTVTLPASLTQISAGIFVDCNALETVYSLATTPPEAEYTDSASWTAFGKDNAQLKIYVPAASVEAYKAADGWKEYADAIFADADPANCQILYTSTDGNIVTPNNADVFGATIVSNTYENGQGVITFDGEVTKIGERAFENCSTIASITIPDSVLQIGNWAFASCTNLATVSFGNSLTQLGSYVFYQCANITSITIPQNLTTLGANPFMSCNKLAEFNGKFASADKRCLIIDNEIRSFAPAGLTEYSVLEGVTSVGQSAFEYCGELSAITLPKSIAKIGDSAFRCCGITTIDIPVGVTLIGQAAFYDSRLTEVTIPDKVTSISDDAFGSCSRLASVYCKPTTPPTGGSAMFDNNAADRKIYVPAASVEAYKAATGWSAYADAIVKEVKEADCQILYTSTDGNVVTPNNADVFGATIVSNTYENGQGVITFDGEVTKIGYMAFRECRTLASITIPQSVTSIGRYAFHCNTALTTITLPESVTAIDCNPFIGCANLAEFKGKFATSDGRSLIVDNSLHAIATAGITEYAVPENVTVICDDVFNACGNITSVTMTDSVISIGSYAFYGCGQLANIEIGNGVTTIGASAFSSCVSLTNITIPSSVTSIGETAFYDCSSLQSVYSKPITPPTGGSAMFDNNAANRKIYVPDASVEAYKTAAEWSTYADAIVAEEVPANYKILYTSTDGNVVTPNATDVFGANIVSNTYENGQGVITFDSAVTSVGNYAFYKCRNLTSVTIPNGVTLIGNNAFDECSISSIIIPDGVESIGTDAFIYCHNLTEVHIPQNVINLGGNPFRSCNGLAKFSGKYASADGRLLVQNGNIYSFAQAGLVEYTITEPGVNTIGWELFRDCESLVEVTIPQTITKIDFEAFYNCSSLKSVYCKPTTPPTGEDYMFNNNAADRKIYVPAASVEAYKAADGWKEYADAIVAEGATSGVVDLSVAGTANCYLVNGAGNYKFKAVKGNSLENFSNGYSADVLWESFGTSTTPNVGDLITNVAYKDGYISFSTPATFKSGNASIALRDSSGKILWSWHIWCSAEGWNDQVYPNNAGTMMDRNLGATSATPGDIGAFGLMYQWGRKDPFMGTCAMTGTTFAASTGSWDVASSDNMDFAVENPMTFATDWYGGGVAGEGWHTSESEKGLYDPCPVGYRVPDGGENGFWATALGTSGITSAGTELDSANYGRHWTLADGTTAAWYPAVGVRHDDGGALYHVGSSGFCWSASPDPSDSSYAYHLYFDNGDVNPASVSNRSSGYSVRCVRE